jgi:site-specific recombinase XerD
MPKVKRLKDGRYKFALDPNATVHTLRHSFALHLLDKKLHTKDAD